MKFTGTWNQTEFLNFKKYILKTRMNKPCTHFLCVFMFSGLEQGDVNCSRLLEKTVFKVDWHSELLWLLDQAFDASRVYNEDYYTRNVSKYCVFWSYNLWEPRKLNMYPWLMWCQLTFAYKMFSLFAIVALLLWFLNYLSHVVVYNNHDDQLVSF